MRHLADTSIESKRRSWFLIDLVNHVWELQPTCIMKLAKIAPHFNTTTKHWPASTCASAPWPPRCAPSGWWAGRPWCRSAGPTRSRAAATPDWGCGSPPSVPVCGMSWIDATRRGGDSKRGQTPRLTSLLHRRIPEFCFTDHLLRVTIFLTAILHLISKYQVY